MERVRCLLTGLFRQVLSEHGREAPALTDIVIERAVGRVHPRVFACFSNGHRAAMPARAADFYEFCGPLAGWDLDDLHFALASVGHEIYAQMIVSRQAQIAGQDHYDSPRAETLEPDAGRGLRAWWNRLRFSRDHRLLLAVEREAHDRGIRLLIKNLSPVQRAQYETYGYFDVTGGETGKRYRITNAYQMNVQEIGKNGKRMRLLCFMPKGGLVLGDVLLAQKLALELFESHALAVANAISGRSPPIALLP